MDKPNQASMKGKVGVCKLTGKEGKFVNSHLLPKALTTAGGLGTPLSQSGVGRRPEIRHSSWYDNGLVTAEGEKILADLDDWAIKKLRRLRLVWSGWGPMMTLTDHDQIPGTEFGIREIEDADWMRLRVFFLSLLWRAAASTRYEFGDVSLPEFEVEELRKMILDGKADPINYFQVQLIQLSTRGFEHNHTPVADAKTIGRETGDDVYEVSFFRFYLDGLIIHFDRRPIMEIAKRNMGDLVLGNSSRLIVTTVTYKESFQRKILEAVVTEADNWNSERRS